MLLNQFSLPEIEDKLKRDELPFSGVTLSASAEFHFLRPSFYAGVALHAGNRVRTNLDPVMSATAEERFREEDPYTNRFLNGLPIQIIARDSRFEYDLNREPHRAIYGHERNIWGIRVWNKELNEKERNLSLISHREFHDLMDVVVRYLLLHGKYALLFDIHSYCFQRKGAIPWYRDPNPEINIGSKAVNRTVFGKIIEDFKQFLYGLNIDDHPIRVKENAVFGGGYLARRLSKAYPDRLLVLAMEYKKIFMNELTGELDKEKLDILIEQFNLAVEELVHSEFFATPSDR